MSELNEGWYIEDPDGGWSRTWVTACVPGASCWGGRVSISSLNSVCVECACVFASKPQAGPAIKQEILGLVSGGDRAQAGIWGVMHKCRVPVRHMCECMCIC